jgi:hypothetical protein
LGSFHHVRDALKGSAVNSLYLLIGAVGSLGICAPGACPAAAQQAEAPSRSRDVILRLDHIPDAYLKIGVPAGATVHRWPPEYGAVSWAGATLYVRKDFKVPRSIGCANRNLVDEIDLSGIRRNGFHLIDARAAPAIPPDGGDFQSGSPSVELLTGDGVPTENIRDAEKVRLRAVVWQKDQKRSAPVQCTSAYRLNIVLRGPGGKDPLVGLRTGPSNN